MGTITINASRLSRVTPRHGGVLVLKAAGARWARRHHEASPQREGRRLCEPPPGPRGRQGRVTSGVAMPRGRIGTPGTRRDTIGGSGQRVCGVSLSQGEAAGGPGAALVSLHAPTHLPSSSLVPSLLLDARRSLSLSSPSPPRSSPPHYLYSFVLHVFTNLHCSSLFSSLIPSPNPTSSAMHVRSSSPLPAQSPPPSFLVSPSCVSCRKDISWP